MQGKLSFYSFGLAPETGCLGADMTDGRLE